MGEKKGFFSKEGDEKETTYDVCLECINCEVEDDYDIPRGTKIDEFIKEKDEDCKNCGCKGLRKPDDDD